MKYWLTAACCGMLVCALHAENLLSNGDFEGAPNWGFLGTMRGIDSRSAGVRSPDAARNGKFGLKVSDTWENASPYPVFSVPAVPDANGYRFRCYVKSPEGEHTFRMGIFLSCRKDGKNKNLVWRVREFSAGPEWREFAVETVNKPGVEKVGVFIGATGADKSLKGAVFADDAVLETCEPKKDMIPEKPAKQTDRVEPFCGSASFDPGRVERHGQGYRLKAGQNSLAADPKAAPDITFRNVEVPRDGFYRFSVRPVGPRMTAHGRLGVPDLPGSRVQMMRPTMPSGRPTTIGVFPLKKGKVSITLSLPEKITVDGLDAVWVGPKPLPEDIRNHPLRYVPRGRPRLWIDREHLAVLRRDLNHPEFARALKKLRAAADSPVELVMEPGCEVVCQPLLEEKLRAQAFCALVEDDAAKKRAVAQTAHAYFSRLSGFPMANNIVYAHISNSIMTAAAVYDWCYDGFTPDRRQSMIAAFRGLACRQEGGWAPGRDWMLVGHGTGISAAYLAFGIACFDEDPEIFRFLAYQFTELFVPMRKYQYRSGLHPQGSFYGSGRLCFDLRLAALFRIACGKDLFGDTLNRLPLYWQMIRLPDMTCFDEGDVWGRPSEPADFTQMLAFCTAATRDPAYKGHFLAMNGDEREYFFHLLLNDPEIKPVPPFSVRLPYIRHFGPLRSNMIARTGFYDDEAAVYFNGGGKCSGNHQHSDAGAFQIWYRGPLASDIGAYGSTYGNPYDRNFNKRSIAHNMLRVYDPAEKFGGGKFDNDGGSRFVYQTNMPSTPAAYEKSPQLDYGTSHSVSIGPDKMRPAYGFLAADLTNAYSKKIRHYMRLFVFLNQQSKEQPAGFLVCDLVESAQPDLLKIFQVSSFFPPVLRENFIGLVTPQGGCADMRLYLPAQTKITDFADEKAASNPQAGKVYEVPFSPYGPASHAHRIEVTPTEKRAFDTFLAHFGIRAKDAAPLAEGYAELANAHLVRSGKFLVTLPKQDKLVDAPLVFDVPEGGAQVLCTYLAPGPWHAAGSNFTVRDGENTLFLAAPAGKLEVAPGKLDGASEYQVPAACTPPAGPADPAGIVFNGEKLNGKPVLIDGQALVPLNAFPGRFPAFADGRDTVDCNGVEIAMPVPARKIGGELHVPLHTVAGLLHARVFFDPCTLRAELNTLPPEIPAVIRAETGTDAEKLLALIRHHGLIAGSIDVGCKNFWTVRDQYAFTLTFDRPCRLGGVAVSFAAGHRNRFPVRISGSSDGREFHLLFDGLSEAGKTRSVFRWTPEVLRYLRIEGRRSESSPWISINDLDFAVDRK